MALTFRFLGTASGLPEVDRFGQTTVVTNDAPGGRIEHVLLDAGDGAASLLMRHRYDLLAIRSIAISHMHGDHHGGFVQVVKTMMHLNRSDDLVVLAPDEGIEGLRHYLELSYLIEEMLGFHIDWVPLSQCADNPIEIAADISLTAFSNNHLRHARERLAGRTDLPGPIRSRATRSCSNTRSTELSSPGISMEHAVRKKWRHISIHAIC